MYVNSDVLNKISLVSFVTRIALGIYSVTEINCNSEALVTFATEFLPEIADM